MGSEEYEDESPVHEVPISAFRMGKTPVTVAMWEEYVSHTGASIPPVLDPKFDGAQKFNVGWKDKDHPFVNVNWDECNKYANWASEISGLKFTLPSESQWEYACRGGRDGLKYPWGNNFDRSKIWCSDTKLGDRGSTGSINRNVYVWRDHLWGLVDMVGNVREWCLDWYDPKWYQIPQASERDVVNLDSSPTLTLEYIDNTSESKPARCVRGSSWKIKDPVFFRCADRGWLNQEYWNFDFGFRLSARTD